MVCLIGYFTGLNSSQDEISSPKNSSDLTETTSKGSFTKEMNFFLPMFFKYFFFFILASFSSSLRFARLLSPSYRAMFLFGMSFTSMEEGFEEGVILFSWKTKSFVFGLSANFPIFSFARVFIKVLLISLINDCLFLGMSFY